jgi:hypothetical protein
MKIGGCFKGKYLKASDIPDGRDVLAQIDVVEIHEMEKSDEEKPVLRFIGKERGLVLNKTNSSVLSTAFGEETDNWHGKTVALFATVTDFAGRSVPCIRLKIPRQQAALSAPTTVAAPSAAIDAEPPSLDLPF